MTKSYQIVILGPGGVGKTKGTLRLMKILNQRGFITSEVKPWSEDLVVTSNYVIHNFIIPHTYFPEFPYEMNIAIYDMGGQFKYQKMWEKLAANTDAIIVIVDMTRKNTLKQVPLMLPKGIMQDVPVRLLVNKADLYTDFVNAIEDFATSIYQSLQLVVQEGLVNYFVKYRGEAAFNFGGKTYNYGDIITVSRTLQRDASGHSTIRLADLEVIAARSFKKVMPDLTDHNSYLFGREFTLQLFDIVYSWLEQTETTLTPEIIETAHTEAPPFISWGQDPNGIIPRVEQISFEAIKTALERMLISDEDVVEMVVKLREQNYNLDLKDKNSWALTSAQLMAEDPEYPYKPIDIAMLPPYFVHNMIAYSEARSEFNQNYFV